MLRNKKEKKKRSWELLEEEDDNAPSEVFLKLQDELKERELLAKEKEQEAIRLKIEQEQEHIRENNEADEINESLEKAQNDGHASPPCLTIKVSNYSHKTRIFEFKQHFHQFGDLVEIVIRGKETYLTFDREQDASDAVMDGSAAPLLGKRLRVEFARNFVTPQNGFHGPYRWHRDDALRKKEGMRYEKEVRQQQLDDRRAKEKEYRKYEKEREKRRKEEREKRDLERQSSRQSRQRSRSRDRDSSDRYRRDGDRYEKKRERSRSRDRDRR